MTITKELLKSSQGNLYTSLFAREAAINWTVTDKSRYCQNNEFYSDTHCQKPPKMGQGRGGEGEEGEVGGRKRKIIILLLALTKDM